MIAISYRREDSLPIAGRLYDRLQAEFGKGNVFMDFDSIPYGVDFRDHIKQMIDGSKVLVALIGPDWVGKQRQKKRRIDDPGDFVRLEIAYALERGLPVIPVLINDTPMPKASDLPPDIEALAFRNAVTLSVGIDFHHHADRLVVGIDRLVRKAREAAAIPKATGPPLSPRIERPFVAGLFQEHESHSIEPSGSAPKMRTGPTQLPRESAPPSRVEKSPGEPGRKPILSDSQLKRSEPPIERWSYWRRLCAEIQEKWPSISQTLKDRTDPVSRGGILVLVLLVTGVLGLYYGFPRAREWLQTPILRSDSEKKDHLTFENASAFSKYALKKLQEVKIRRTSPIQTPASGAKTIDERPATDSSSESRGRDLELRKSELDAMYSKALHEADVYNFQEALKELDAIDARQPNLAESHNLRGVIFMRQGLYDRAKTPLLEALRIDPKFWNARFNLAEISFLRKDWHEARKGFEELLSSGNSEVEGDAAPFIRYKILLTYLFENKTDMANALVANFELSPDTPGAYFAKAAVAFSRESTKVATEWVSLAEGAFSSDANKPFVDSLFEVGWMQRPTGQLPSVMELTKMAERVSKTKPVAASKFDEAANLIPAAQRSPIPASPSTTKTPELRNSHTWQEWIGDFVRQFVSINQLHDVDATLAFYAPNVDYFDDHEKDHTYIRNDIETYNQRWPVRYDWIEGDLMLSEKTPERDYTAGFKLNFYAGSTERALWSQGQFAINLDITITDGIPQISGIKEKVLRQEKGILPPGSPSAESSPPADAKRNSFGMIEGNYVCRYVAAPKTRRVDDKATGKKDVVRVTYGSKIVIRGTRFSHVFSLDQQPTPAGARTWSRMRYSVQTDGEISRNGATYLLKPDRVELIEKFPKNLADSKTSILRERQRLSDTKWIIRYDETRLVQTSNGELWSLENSGNH